MIRLSERLNRIATYLIDCESIADIGTDHAYLPIYIAQSGNAKKFILTDINEGPLQKAKLNCEKYLSNDSSTQYSSNIGDGLIPMFSFRIGDGLIPIANGEVEACVIAGMGGELIVNILSADKVKTDSIKRYVLQPRTKCDELRQWLCENKYSIIAEDLAKERGKICEIIVVSTEKSTGGESLNQLDYLLNNNNPLFEEYLMQKIGTEERILEGLANSKRKEDEGLSELIERERLSLERIEIFSNYLVGLTDIKL